MVSTTKQTQTRITMASAKLKSIEGKIVGTSVRVETTGLAVLNKLKIQAAILSILDFGTQIVIV